MHSNLRSVLHIDESLASKTNNLPLETSKRKTPIGGLPLVSKQKLIQADPIDGDNNEYMVDVKNGNANILVSATPSLSLFLSCFHLIWCV
jgi:hypothetical protein